MADSTTLENWVDNELPGALPDTEETGTLAFWEGDELPPWMGGPGTVAPIDCAARCDLEYIELTWTDTNSSSVGYEIRRSIDGGALVLVGTTAIGATSFIDHILNEELRAYYYRISPVGDETFYCEATVECRAQSDAYWTYFVPQAWEDEGLEASYSIVVRGTNGVQQLLIDDYRDFEYLRVLNDQGFYSMTSETSMVDPDPFQLDHIVEIWRAPPGQDWREDFTGFHRYKNYAYDNIDNEFMVSRGPGLENLLRRRIIEPTEGISFLTIDDQLTDIMLRLVNTQCGPGADADRRMPGLSIISDLNSGPAMRLNFRYTNLFKDLSLLSEIGCDFAITHDAGAEFTFRVYYQQRGMDRTVGNTDGNSPVIFSLEMGNMQNPSIELDRLAEITHVYVAGEGAGAQREIVERTNIEGDDSDSPWNRVESFLEASQEFTTGSLMALGDAFLVENKKKFTFTCTAIPLVRCLYGVHWDLGDLVTGYYRDTEYILQVKEVHVKVSDAGEVITPTFEVKGMRPSVDYIYWDIL